MLGHLDRPLRGAALGGDRLQELAHPEPAGVASRTPGRQGVVGADRLVPVGHRRVPADEQAAVVGQPGDEPVRVPGLHLEVLGRDLVGHRAELLVVRAEDHGAVVPPGGAGDPGGRPGLQPAVDLADRRLAQLARGGGQDGGRGRAVLGLAEQVAGQHDRVGGLVGDHHDLGRPGQQVDPDRAEQLPLGLRDVGVARPDDQVDRVGVLQPERHPGHRLHPADAEDLVGTGPHHRPQLGRMHPGRVPRRGRREHPADLRHLGHRDRHHGRGDQRVVPAGRVGTDAADRDPALPEQHPGQRLRLEVHQGVPLQPGEPGHLVDQELRAGGHRGLHLLDRPVDRLRWHPEGRRRPAVEPFRVPPDGARALPLDVGEHRADRVLDLLGDLLRGGQRSLEVLH